jgi:hypothetical protein
LNFISMRMVTKYPPNNLHHIKKDYKFMNNPTIYFGED